MKIERKGESAKGVSRDYSILITGLSDSSAFLRQVYEGALSVTNFYDSATYYYVPDVALRNESFHYLFEYAGFIDADCVITYFDSVEENLKPPINVSGKVIPIISIGVNNSLSSSISHIGIDYNELGKKMAEEVKSFFNAKEGNLYILNPPELKGKYGSDFFVNLYDGLKPLSNISIYQYDKMEKIGLPIEDEVRQHLASLGKVDLILSISEQGTLIAAQSVIDLDIGSETKIIGFGEGQEAISYLKKGFVYELLCSDAVDIGKKAMQNFFEYINTGEAERYTTSDIKIIKAN